MNHSSFQVMLLNVFLIMTKLLKKKKLNGKVLRTIDELL